MIQTELIKGGEIVVTILSKKLYTVKELTQILPLSYFSILEYLKKGRIKGIKIGRKYFVTEENLERFIGGN
ncbi:hypothetical protein ES705_40631 [subsurface metagenome]